MKRHHPVSLGLLMICSLIIGPLTAEATSISTSTPLGHMSIMAMDPTIDADGTSSTSLLVKLRLEQVYSGNVNVMLRVSGPGMVVPTIISVPMRNGGTFSYGDGRSELFSTTAPGYVTVNASADGFRSASVTVQTVAPDKDKDGVLDEKDNCPDKYNPAQSDWDRDGYGNLCDRWPHAKKKH